MSIIELAVALMISSMLMIALAGTLGSSIESSRGTRARQNAVTTAMERIEQARNIKWENLGMPSVGPQSPLVEGVTLVGSAAGLGQDEALIVCSAGELEPQVTEFLDGTDYSTRTYVSAIDADRRRVLVVVEWEEEGVLLTHGSDTIISSVSAGRAATGLTPMFPEAAVVAAADVLFHPGSTESIPASAHSASVLTNGDFGNPGSVIDGDVLTGATASVDPTQVFGSVEQNAGTPVDPPSAAEVEGWRSVLRLAAQEGPVLSGDQVFTDTVIFAPMYVNGSISFYGTVHIEGSGPVYATGSIRLMNGAAVTAHGSALIADSNIEFTSGATFDVTDPSFAGVIGFGSSAFAVRITGGPDLSIQGLAYAPYGGVMLTGGAAWHGAIVAHGVISGVVDVSGGSLVSYPANLLPTSSLLVGLRPETVSTPGGCV